MARNLAPFVLALAVAGLVLLALSRCGTRQARVVVRADAVLTPGMLNPAVTQHTIRQTICVAGWTRTIRPPSGYTSALKLEQMRRYGLTGSPQGYEEDHLVSLELGGNATDPRNLWPEPRPRANEVDVTENELNRRVCEGSLSLAAAQQRIADIKHRDG